MEINLMELEPNIPSTDFGTYCTFLAGPPKIGKTTLCSEFDKPLLLDFEEGSKGLVGYRIPITKWIEVRKIVRQLVANPQLKEKFKTICFDTVNYCVPLVKQYVTDQEGAESFDKIGYGKGWDKLDDEFRWVINNLKRAGYGIVMVSHVKNKTVGEEESAHYKLVPDLPDRIRNLLCGMADFLLTADFEYEVIQAAEFEFDKKGNKKLIKEAETKTIRVLHLRESKDVQAGFRWKLPEGYEEKIPFTISALQDVFEKAVTEEIERGKNKFGLDDKIVVSIVEKLELEREKQKEETIKAMQEEENQEKKQKQLEDVVNQIKLLCKEKASRGIDVKEINKIVGKLKFETTEQAEEVLHKLQQLS